MRTPNASPRQQPQLPSASGSRMMLSSVHPVTLTSASPASAEVTSSQSPFAAAGPRLVSEEDMQKERERWMQMCMHEVWKLENSAFERIQRHLDEAMPNLKQTLEREMDGLLRAEKGERALELSELRREVRESRQLETDVAALRRDVAALRAERATALALPADDVAARLATSDAGLADLRTEIQRLWECQEVQKASATSDLRRVLDDQASRVGGEQSRALEEVSTREAAARGVLRSELKQEMDKLRFDLREAAKAKAGENAAATSEFEIATRELRCRIDDLVREMASQRQDSLSETTVLRGRLEAVVGERDVQMAKVEAMQLTLKEEQGRRAADASRLDALEATSAQLLRRASEAKDAGAQDATMQASPGLQARLEAAERQLSTLPTSFAAEFSVLRARISEAEDNVRRRAVSAAAASALEASSTSTITLLQRGLEEARVQIDRLGLELQEERRERAKVFTDIGELTESVTRAATNSIESAHRRLAEEIDMPKGLVTARGMRPPLANVAPSPRGSLENSLASRASRDASDGGDYSNPGSRRDVGSFGGSLPDPLGSSLGAGDDPRGSMNAGLARLVGEMDAELRVEFSSRVKVLTAELRGEILGEVGAKMSTIEAALGGRLRAVEAENLGQRVANLEVDLRCLSLASQTGDSGKFQAVSKSIAQELASARGVAAGGHGVGSEEVVRTPGSACRETIPARTGAAAKDRRFDPPSSILSASADTRPTLVGRLTSAPAVADAASDWSTSFGARSCGSDAAATATGNGEGPGAASSKYDVGSIKASLESLVRTISNSSVLGRGGGHGRKASESESPRPVRPAASAAQPIGSARGSPVERMVSGPASQFKRSEVPPPRLTSPSRGAVTTQPPQRARLSNGGGCAASSGDGAIVSGDGACAGAQAAESPGARLQARGPAGAGLQRLGAAGATGAPNLTRPGTATVPARGLHAPVVSAGVGASGANLTPSSLRKATAQLSSPGIRPAQGYGQATLYNPGVSR
eukprot:TRINITY_DN18997_c0_g1_i1.p1 TRINITY_DN18997_c0_g1~~TRINITY_DN18997_c0_g1_i1.p1  ORF type:complete len:995 (+),score=218.51 TRINITY_DN18997_c0_g1_i1:123-3107(+)